MIFYLIDLRRVYFILKVVEKRLALTFLLIMIKIIILGFLLMSTELENRI